MVTAVMILVTVCLIGVMVADILIRRSASPPDKARETAGESSGTAGTQPSGVTDNQLPGDAAWDIDLKKSQPGLMGKNGHPVLYEVFEELEDVREKAPSDRPSAVDDRVKIALIIDDIGYDKKVVQALYALEPNISFSVLPWSPFGRAISRMLADLGAEIMLHLPMEPVEYPEVNPGPGALLTSMSPDVLIIQLEQNLAEVAGVIGVNNHMGSMFTTRASQMNQIFTILKKRDLFFIDSRTAPKSQCRASARLLQVRFAERDVFLDNLQDIGYITGQFAQLKEIARKYGPAIGIGHPYPATLEALKIELPKIKGQIDIVPASQIVTIPG